MSERINLRLLREYAEKGHGELCSPAELLALIDTAEAAQRANPVHHAPLEADSGCYPDCTACALHATLERFTGRSHPDPFVQGG